jgi:septum formation protein
MPPPRLILASASPRRQSLLREAGYLFVLSPADINEEDHPAALKPGELAAFLANAKAEAVAAQFPHDITLGADTVVALGDQQLGKPTDAPHAREMLRSLSGTTHEVVTGVALVGPARGFRRSALVRSTVQMRTLTDAEVDRYVAGGEWRGKAGGYGIQDDDPFVTRMAGSLSNIVGLPMEATVELLAAAGIEPGGLK